MWEISEQCLLKDVPLSSIRGLGEGFSFFLCRVSKRIEEEEEKLELAGRKKCRGDEVQSGSLHV